MELATKSIHLSFNKEKSWKIDRVSMGSLSGPLLANVFVGFQVKLLF